MPIIVNGSGSTVQNIVDRALRLISQIESGQSGTANETADALIALNALLDTWRNERLLCYSMQDESVPLSSGNTTRTLGPSGDYVTTRPVQIEAAYVVVSSISYPVRLLDEEQYAAIGQKAVTAPWPTDIWYQPSIPNGTIYPYPVPSASSILHLITRTPLNAFTSASDSISLPPGWEEALATNLALSIAPEYSAQPSPLLMAMATSSKASIKRVNSRPIRTTTEIPQLVGHRTSNILTDTP